MNRISKYRQSIDKFINEKIDFHDNNFKLFIITELSKTNFFIAISILTITNKFCYVNNCNQHGYYIAVASELLFFLKNMIEKDVIYKTKLSDKYSTYIGYIISVTYKLILQNVNLIVKLNMSNKCFQTIYSNIISLIYILTSHILVKDTSSYSKCKIITHIPNLDENSKEILNSIDKINKEELKDYIFLNYGLIISKIFEIICISFDNKDIIEVMKYIAFDLSMIIKINYDILYLSDDIQNLLLHKVDHSFNLIIHTDIYPSFELYIDVKRRLIEKLLKCSMLTETFKDMFEIFDKNFDAIIEETNPEISTAFIM